MNVALIGSGGRENALAYKIAESPDLDQLYNIPGNPGTAKYGENVNISASDFESILTFCNEKNIELVVIGPEQPLVDGLSDLLRKNRIKVFGPSKSAARIEGDKSFAKFLMKKYNIPTADFKVFNIEQEKETLEYLKSQKYPVVIKASGLAAGKGVLICSNFEEAEKALELCFRDKKFGDSGNTIVIEEFLEGAEASIFAITDGQDFITLPPSQDHKRIFNDDKGDNTGGMGAYAPAPVINEKILNKIYEDIIIPTLKGMEAEGMRYEGCLYCGLMITPAGPKVIEFNCRFGDPETQCVLPVIEGNFLKLLDSSALGQIDKNLVVYNGGASVCVVTASKGYPEKYEKGFEITGIEDAENDNLIVFHAGTTEKDGKIFTNGGRVLGVTSFIKSNDLKYAKQISYNAINKVKYNNIYFRTDISDKAIK